MHQCLCQKFVKNLFVSSACSILFSIYLLIDEIGIATLFAQQISRKSGHNVPF